MVELLQTGHEVTALVVFGYFNKRPVLARTRLPANKAILLVLERPVESSKLAQLHLERARTWS